MPLPITLRHGIPSRFAVRIQSGSSGLDMSTVTAVTFRVHGGAFTCEWSATVTDQGTTGLTATMLVAASECPGAGGYKVTPLLTVAGQEWPELAQDFNLTVVH